MGEPSPSILDTRRAQMFPTLADEELTRLARFGERRRYAAGERVMRAGAGARHVMDARAGRIVADRHHHRVDDRTDGFVAERAFGQVDARNTRMMDLRARHVVQRRQPRRVDNRFGRHVHNGAVGRVNDRARGIMLARFDR